MDKKEYPEINEESLEIAAEHFPDSIIPDLLMNFPAKVVVKFIVAFSGQRITVPRIESVWRCYRNKLIKKRLDENNSAEIRRELAFRFGITENGVRLAYERECEREKKRAKISGKTIERVTSGVFVAEAKEAIKDMKNFSKKGK